MTPTSNVAETPTEAAPSREGAAEPVAERILVTAMVLNPLVSLDRTQLLAAAGRVGVARAPRAAGSSAASSSTSAASSSTSRVGRSEARARAGRQALGRPGVRGEPLYHRRLMQSYLAVRAGVHAHRRRGRTSIRRAASAAASRSRSSPRRWRRPTRSLGNPAALKRAVETRGASLVAGLAPPRRATCATTAACRRRSIAARSASARTSPSRRARSSSATRCSSSSSTGRRRRRSSSGRSSSSRRRSTSTTSSTWRRSRSLIEFAVKQGFQVFAVSWRNADAGAARVGPRHLRAGAQGRERRDRSRSPARSG